MSLQASLVSGQSSEPATLMVRRFGLFSIEDNNAAKQPEPPIEPRANKSPDKVCPVIPGYEMIRQLGRGGMGVVYLAREVALNRLVAIKFVANSAFTEAEALDRFQREAESVAALRHPNIIQIFGVGGTVDSIKPGCPFIVLEYADGGTLAAHTGKPIAPRVAADLVATLADAIQCAHVHGIVHRDLKPTNVLMHVTAKLEKGTRESLQGLTPKLTDFGVAKRMETTQGDSQTMAGSMIGTPEYMAPEQAMGRSDIGPAADVYALGVILYELLTGQVPLRGADTLETLMMVRTHEPVRPSRLLAKLPRDLDTICTRCLQKDPGQRFSTASALRDDLRAWLDGHPIGARPIGTLERSWKWAARHPAIALLLFAVFALSALGVAGVFWQWQRAEARALAEQQAHIVADLARQNAETALYFGRIHVAQHELTTGNQWDAIRVLEACRPGPGQVDRRSWEWHYLNNFSRCAKLSFQASSHWVWDVAFSPDGQLLATAAGSPFSITDSSPGEIAIWDCATGNLVRRLDGHTRAARRVSFSPDGQYLLSFGYDQTARIWSVTTGQQITEPLPALHDGHHHWYAFGNAGPGWFTPDNKAVIFRGPKCWHRWEFAVGRLEDVPTLQVVLSVSSDRSMAIARESGTAFSIIDLTTFERIRQIDVPSGVDRAVISPDKTWVATTNGNLVEVYDVATARRVHIYNGPSDWVEALEISPDGQRVAAAGSDRAIFVWPAGQRTNPVSLIGHTTEVRALAFSPDGQHLASCDQLGRVMIWDANRNPRQQAINGHMHSSVVSALALTPDGNEILTVRFHGSIQRFDASGRRLSEKHLNGFSNQIRFPRTDVQFNADASLVFGPFEKDLTSVGSWDTSTCEVVQKFCGHSLPISGISLSRDGKRIATSAGTMKPDGPTVKETFVWDVASGQLLHKVTNEMILGLALTSDGTRLAGATLTGDVVVWDVASGRELWRQQGHGDEQQIAENNVHVFAVAISDDDRLLATGGFHDGIVRLWNMATGKPHPAPMVSRPSLTGITFTRDCKRVAAAGYDSEIRMWDVADGHLAIVLLPPSGPRRGDIAHTARPVFSLRNNQLALVDSHGFIGVWNGRE